MVDEQSKITFRITKELQKRLDNYATLNYPSHISGKGNRSQVIVEAIIFYLDTFESENLNNKISPHKNFLANKVEQDPVSEVQYAVQEIKQRLEKMERYIHALELKLLDYSTDKFNH